MKTQTKKWILIVAITAVTLAIWGMSLRTGSVSLKQTETIVQPMVEQVTTPGNWTDFFTVLVRKSAHFIEFGLLGILWGCYSRLQKLRIPWLYGLPVALIDETIQYFVPGRSPAWEDVALDYIGYLVGFGLIVLIATLIRRKSKK